MSKRLYPERPIVGVGAIIIQNGSVLLERRANEPGKGKWSVPGGLVELGENPEDAVVREVKEETCLNVRNPKLLDVVTTVTLDDVGKIKYNFVIIDYFVTVNDGEPLASSDAVELRWVSLPEVYNYQLTKSIKEFFEKNMDKLRRLNSYL